MGDQGSPRMLEALRRAFHEFLAIPTAIVVAFLALAAVMLFLERAEIPGLEALHDGMQRLVFSDPSATSQLLSTIAGGMITLTSITFSVLLLAVQQSAASMSHAVFDQYLRRSMNQVYFGFFVGVALYALLVLAATGPDANPVIGASLALLLAVVALLLLIVLIYTTVNQMQPAVISEAIHGHTLKARQRQLERLRRTRAQPRHQEPGRAVRSKQNGYVVQIDDDAIGRALSGHDAELMVQAHVGSYVVHDGALAELRGSELHDVEDVVRGAFKMDHARDIDGDPGYGVEQLTNIAWTSISTSKQNPAPGRIVILTLRDLLVRCSGDRLERDDDSLPIVDDDGLIDELLNALELLATACSESMQAQNLAEVLNSLTIVYDGLPVEARARAVDVAMRSLSGLGDQVLTLPLGQSLERLSETISLDYPMQALALRTARGKLALSIGELNSRSTRVPS